MKICVRPTPPCDLVTVVDGDDELAGIVLDPGGGGGVKVIILEVQTCRPSEPPSSCDIHVHLISSRLSHTTVSGLSKITQFYRKKRPQTACLVGELFLNRCSLVAPY